MRSGAARKVEQMLREQYRWDAFENVHGNEQPHKCDLPFKAEPDCKEQRRLLSGPSELLRVFKQAAARHKKLGDAFRTVAGFFDKVSGTCETHKLGLKGVSPPKQKEWLDLFAGQLRQFAKQGPGAA